MIKPLVQGNYIITGWVDGDTDNAVHGKAHGLIAHIYSSLDTGISDTPLFIPNTVEESNLEEAKANEISRGLIELETFLDARANPPVVEGEVTPIV